jgi:hypothetical protein
VVASTNSDVYQLLRSNYGDALAVEMESHGFLKAVRAHPEINALIIVVSPISLMVRAMQTLLVLRRRLHVMLVLLHLKSWQRC